mmetsp:Transcript_26234/g.55642  ORF Transcript_26234/g.55642 Transcript_26234/m.55642 type:complete len:243 (+) Transcript_26234:3796-4524(+)
MRGASSPSGYTMTSSFASGAKGSSKRSLKAATASVRICLSAATRRSPNMRFDGASVTAFIIFFKLESGFEGYSCNAHCRRLFNQASARRSQASAPSGFTTPFSSCMILSILSLWAQMTRPKCTSADFSGKSFFCERRTVMRASVWPRRCWIFTMASSSTTSGGSAAPCRRSVRSSFSATSKAFSTFQKLALGSIFSLLMGSLRTISACSKGFSSSVRPGPRSRKPVAHLMPPCERKMRSPAR